MIMTLINAGANILVRYRGSESSQLLHRAAVEGWDDIFKAIAMWRHHRRLKYCDMCTKKINELVEKGELPFDPLA